MAVERDRPGGRNPVAPVPGPDQPLEPTTPLPQSTAGLRTPDGSTLEVGAVVAGRFAIVRFIARGGMGAVYEAEDTTLRTRVAMKTILPEFSADPNAMERFRREVLLARRITHFNVCRIFELYDTFDPRGDRLSFLTMELLHGETLAERLARTGPLATAELSVLLRQLADGLEAMGRRRGRSGVFLTLFLRGRAARGCAGPPRSDLPGPSPARSAWWPGPRAAPR